MGAAYERELDGQARTKAYGESLPSSSLTGNTGLGEVGITVIPNLENDFAMSLGVQGFVDKREGVMGSVHLQYPF